MIVTIDRTTHVLIKPGDLSTVEGVRQELVIARQRIHELEAAAVQSLTPRERQAIEVYIQGAKGRASAAEAMNISENTHAVLLLSACRKLNVHCREDAIRILKAHGKREG